MSNTSDNGATSIPSTLSTMPGETTNLAAVEKELNKLWSRIAGADGKNPILRATTLNLVLHTDDPNSVPGLIAEFTEAHPCRTIVVQGDETAADAIKVLPTVFSRRSLGTGEGRTQVCCEEILLQASSAIADRVRTAVESLLISDLPVYFFQQGELSLSDPFMMGPDRLISELDGLIVDSSRYAMPAKGIKDLSALLGNADFRTNLYDLNWERLVPWRRVLAQSFDNLADRERIDKITEVEIRHSGARMQALLYLGWLISRLGLELFAAEEGDSWKARIGANTVALRLREEAVDRHGLHSVTITADGRPYFINVSENGNFLIASDGIRRTLRLPEQSPGALLGSIIDSNGPDRMFEDALSTAMLLTAQIGALSPRAGIVVAEDAPSLARLAARYFVQTARWSVERRGRFTVALSGGSTPKAMYQLLAELPFRDEVPWANVHVFCGDERDVPPDHPDSNQRMAREALLNCVPIPPVNIHVPLAGRLPAKDAAAGYANEIRSFFKLKDGQIPEFDLILLGLGDDGHTASLFPHSEALKADDKALFVANPVPKLNTNRLTLTAGAINHAAHVVFLVSGKSKADILATVFKGPLQPDDYPAQRIQPELEGALIVMADQDAVSKIKI
jgi:6-phosphogluconolactonase